MSLFPRPSAPWPPCSPGASPGFWEQLCLVGTGLEAGQQALWLRSSPLTYGSPPPSSLWLSWVRRHGQQLWLSRRSPRCPSSLVGLQCLRRDHLAAGGWGVSQLQILSPPSPTPPWDQQGSGESLEICTPLPPGTRLSCLDGWKETPCRGQGVPPISLKSPYYWRTEGGGEGSRWSSLLSFSS